MKRRILLVDDEVAVLLTLKAVLEISGFDVETAASAREAKLKLRSNQYNMVITDMRMESDASGAEVIEAARTAPFHPAVALLTAFPLSDEDWQEIGADQMLVKPMHTRILLQQLEDLLANHERTLTLNGGSGSAAALPAKTASQNTSSKKASKKSTASRSSAAKKAPAKKAVAVKVSGVVKKAATAKKAVAKALKKPTAKKAAGKKASKKLAKK